MMTSALVVVLEAVKSVVAAVAAQWFPHVYNCKIQSQQVEMANKCQIQELKAMHPRHPHSQPEHMAACMHVRMRSQAWNGRLGTGLKLQLAAVGVRCAWFECHHHYTCGWLERDDSDSPSSPALFA